MKKILSILVVFCAAVITGCSCSKNGVYEFESMIVIEGNESKSYSCSDEEKTSNQLIANTCAMYEEREIELTKDNKIINRLDGVVISEAMYKIEEGILYVKLNENSEYDEYATYEKGKIIVDLVGTKIVFEKD